jgi:transposase-like protein
MKHAEPGLQQRLRLELDSTRKNSRGHRRFRDNLRQEVAKYALEEFSQGIAYSQTARSLGVSGNSICLWVNNFRKSECSEGREEMLAVEIAKDEALFTLEGPGGFRVTGVSAKELATIMLAVNAG